MHGCRWQGKARNRACTALQSPHLPLLVSHGILTHAVVGILLKTRSSLTRCAERASKCLRSFSSVVDAGESICCRCRGGLLPHLPLPVSYAMRTPCVLSAQAWIEQRRGSRVPWTAFLPCTCCAPRTAPQPIRSQYSSTGCYLK